MTRGYNNDPRRLVRMRRLKQGPRPPQPGRGQDPRERQVPPGGKRAARKALAKSPPDRSG
ncbi:MAG: hypothetical protein HY704_07545 [Gemmatimonadetes bacterium]|nr:hypothetical protein [Gemmatimonadota bacterium]